MNFPITRCGEADTQLEKLVLTNLSNRMKEKGFKEEDVAYVRGLSLFPITDASRIDDETLERLRRLCEVWEVNMKQTHITSHRPVVGPIIVFFKKLLFPLLKIFLKEPFAQQRKFNAEALALLADLAGRSNPRPSSTNHG